MAGREMGQSQPGGIPRFRFGGAVSVEALPETTITAPRRLLRQQSWNHSLAESANEKGCLSIQVVVYVHVLY